MLTIGAHPFLQADSYIDKAFAVTLLGYVAIWLGRYLVSIVEVERISERTLSFFRPFEASIIKNIQSKRSLYFLFFLCTGLTLFITILSSLDGFFLRPRAFFQMNGSLRPLYNVTTTLASLLLSFLALYFLQFKEKWTKILLFLTLFLSLFYGVRAVLIQSLLFYYMFSVFKNQGRFHVGRFFVVVFSLIFLSLELEKIREGIPLFHSPSASFAALVYGNHMSDTRDFAWVLAYWDGEYLLGLSYLASLLSFIPSEILPFRQEYSLANFTSNLIGLDPLFHNGVRSGFFGFVFFNFSYLGVFISGILFGMVLKMADQKLREAIEKRGDVIEAYGKTVPYICLMGLLISSLYWTLYLFLLINGALALLRRVRRCPQIG